jgi:hypothetical protein
MARHTQHTALSQDNVYDFFFAQPGAAKGVNHLKSPSKDTFAEVKTTTGNLYIFLTFSRTLFVMRLFLSSLIKSNQRR